MKKTLVISLVTAIFAGLISGAGAGVGTYYFMSKNNENTQSKSSNVVVEESSLVDAIEKVSPAVVSVIASKDMSDFYQGQRYFYFPGSPFKIELPEQQQPENNSGEKTKIGGGSGFLVTKDGMVVTNRHVVSDDAADYTVILTDGKTYYAKVLSKDPINDFAVLQIYENEDRTNKPSGLPIAELGDSDALKIGSHVIAIGNALSEFDNTTTAGIISGKGRKITASSGRGDASTLTNLLQTDAAINPGNSGGPLINLEGQVIGINTAVAQQANGIGFAIPINDLKPIIESVEKTGRIVRPYLGVRYTEITSEIASKLNLPVTSGAYLVDDPQTGVPAIVKDSPADKAGLRSGDIVTAVNGEALIEGVTLQSFVSDFKVGDTIKLTVLRGGSEVEVKVKLEEFKE